jgi:hypothetical protein
MAASRIMSNLSRLTASDSGEVFVIEIGKTGKSSELRAHACSKLFLKVVGVVLGVVLVFCDCDGDFMVVNAVVI